MKKQKRIEVLAAGALLLLLFNQRALGQAVSTAENAAITIEQVSGEAAALFARISQGSSDGIFLHQRMSIVRHDQPGGRFIGLADVRKVIAHRAVVEIIRLEPGQAPRVGDVLIPEITAGRLGTSDASFSPPGDSGSRTMNRAGGGKATPADWTAIDDRRSRTGLTGLGFKGGVNFARLLGQAPGFTPAAPAFENPRTRTGFVVGIFATYHLTPAVALQPEVLFSSKGAQQTNGTAIYDWRLDYFEVPLLLKFTLPQRSDHQPRPALYGGASAAFNTTARLRLESRDLGAGRQTDLKVKDREFNAIFGGSVEVPFGFGTAVFDARYSIGLGSIDDTLLSREVKHSVFAVLAGVAF